MLLEGRSFKTGGFLLFFMQFTVNQYDSLLQDTVTVKNSHEFRRQLDKFIEKKLIGGS